MEERTGGLFPTQQQSERAVTHAFFLRSLHRSSFSVTWMYCHVNQKKQNSDSGDSSKLVFGRSLGDYQC